MLCRITNTIAAENPAKEKPYEIRDTVLKGFMIRVQRFGAKIYYYAYDAANAKKQRIHDGEGGAL